MSKCLIEVKIKVVDCDGSEDKSPVPIEDGGYKIVINEGDSVSIDNFESAVLRTAFPAIREAISRHLTETSKKKRLSKRAKRK
jgi:hypothetical protein